MARLLYDAASADRKKLKLPAEWTSKEDGPDSTRLKSGGGNPASLDWPKHSKEEDERIQALFSDFNGSRYPDGPLSVHMTFVQALNNGAADTLTQLLDHEEVPKLAKLVAAGGPEVEGHDNRLGQLTKIGTAIQSTLEPLLTIPEYVTKDAHGESTLIAPHWRRSWELLPLIRGATKQD